MTRSRVWLSIAFLAVLLGLASLIVRFLVWDATSPTPGLEGSAARPAATAARTLPT